MPMKIEYSNADGRATLGTLRALVEQAEQANLTDDAELYGVVRLGGRVKTLELRQPK